MDTKELASKIRARLNRYLTNDPFTYETNPEFDDYDAASDVIDDIVEIIRPIFDKKEKEN